MYNISAILWLYQHGYRQKLIQLILGYNQPYISKAVNSARPCVPSIEAMTNEQITRKMVVDRILECRAIPTMGFTDQDKSYIKLLDYCLVDKEKIRKLYFDITQYKISQTLRSKKINKEDFNPALIGISDADWQLFLASTK